MEANVDAAQQATCRCKEHNNKAGSKESGAITHALSIEVILAQYTSLETAQQLMDPEKPLQSQKPTQKVWICFLKNSNNSYAQHKIMIKWNFC